MKDKLDEAKEVGIKECLEVFNARCKIQPTLVDDKIRGIIKVYAGICSEKIYQHLQKEHEKEIEKIWILIQKYLWDCDLEKYIDKKEWNN